MPDVTLQDEGSIVPFVPLTEEGEAWLEDQKKRVMLRISEFSEEQMAKRAVKMMEAPEAIQAAVMGGMGAEGGNRLMEQMSRGAANQGRAGREQRMSQLQEEPVA